MPALSSRAAAKTSLQVPINDFASKRLLKSYADGELSREMDLDDKSSAGVAAPLLKSFMQASHLPLLPFSHYRLYAH